MMMRGPISPLLEAMRRLMGENLRMREPRSRRTHVLTLTDTIGMGGAEQIILTLNQSLDPERFRRTICLTREPDVGDPSGEFDSRGRVQQLRAEGVELLQLKRRSRLNVVAWLRLIRFIRSQRVDVLHAHKFGSNVWGSLIGRLARVPVVLAHEHTWSFEGQRLRRWIDRWVVGRLADAVIAVSEADSERMSKLVGVPRDRIVLIPNGIPTLAPGDRTAIRRAAGIPDGAAVLVTVANLRPQKAIDVLIRALALIRERFPDTYLVIAGGGDRGPLEKLAVELGISAAIVFLGARRDVGNVLAAGDVAVSSSDFEGSPLSTMEYLAAGLPVVATDVGGMPDLVHHGENGLLVPRRDPAALASAVCDLLADPERARQMGERGLELQRREFSLAAMVKRVEALYAERLEASRAPGMRLRAAPRRRASGL
jgi:glycosyltransferase involved in cell wall biosynthesis